MAYAKSDGQQFWKNIIQSIPIPFSVIDVKTYRIVAANSAYMPSEAAIGKTCHEVSHQSMQPCEGDDHLCPLNIVKTTNKGVVLEHLHRGACNGDRIVEIHGYPVFDEAGELTHMIEFSMDITSRKEAEQRLCDKNVELKAALAEIKSAQEQLVHREKLAAIGQLAAGVAHEINNPTGYVKSNLSSMEKYRDRISSYLGLLEEAMPALKREELVACRKKMKIEHILRDWRELLSESEQGMEKIAKIVKGLKSFSRVDDNRLETANINECLEDTLNVVWNELKYKAKMNKNYGDIPAIKCMPHQLEQVFMNLLINAGHAIEKEGEISITTWSDDEALFVAIADTGCGIAPELLHTIFDPFFTTKERGKGTGLGLSICSEIVRKHGGEIAVESAPGKGTAFQVRLPLSGAVVDQETGPAREERHSL